MSRPLRLPYAPIRAEHAVDLGILATGLVLGAAGAVALFAAALAVVDTGRVVAAVGIYALALPSVFFCALLYTAAFGSPRRALFRRIDHAAIFAMIAGTATPFALDRPAGSWGYVLGTALWAAAGIGVFVKLRFPIGPVYRSAAAYVVLGWMAMIAIGPAIASRRVLMLIVLGGIFYTIGVVFFLWRRLPFHRAIWHGFVVAGAAAHYLAVAALVL